MQTGPSDDITARTLHLVPREGEWRLLRDGEDEPLEVFTDLGRALDAATRGRDPVRVVVHERGAA
jgi:hypothetical protein